MTDDKKLLSLVERFEERMRVAPEPEREVEIRLSREDQRIFLYVGTEKSHEIAPMSTSQAISLATALKSLALKIKAKR